MSRPPPSCCAASSRRWRSITRCASPTRLSSPPCNFSQRYIPARQLPDKAVSLLDTACARVAISQTAKPAAVEDARSRSPSLEARSRRWHGARPRRGQGGAHRRDRREAREIQEKLAALKRRGLASALVEEVLAQRKASDLVQARSWTPRRARSPRSRTGADESQRARPTAASLARQGRRTSARSPPDKRMIYRPCRRAGGGLGRLRLDRHTGRPDGRRRGRDGAQPRRHSQPAHRRPDPRPCR